MIRYGFDDLVRIALSQSRAAGGGISSVNWCSGVVFQHTAFPDTDSVVQEKLRRTIHYSSAVFAEKEKYEWQVVRESSTLNLVDVSANAIFRELAGVLKEYPKMERTA